MNNIILENKNFRLTFTENAIVKSLLHKKTNEELLISGEDIALFSLMQARPFNKEIKLSHMNKKRFSKPIDLLWKTIFLQ